MSRVGIVPIDIPESVQISIGDEDLEVSGPKGRLRRSRHPLIKIEVQAKSIVVLRKGDSKEEKALHGLYRSLVSNMVEGVSKGFEKTLEMRGVGFKAEIKEGRLMLNVGLSHVVEREIPGGIEVELVRRPTIEQLAVTHMIMRGADKEALGQFAATVRGICPPEPYKGKGIRYLDEYVRRKAGKKAA